MVFSKILNISLTDTEFLNMIGGGGVAYQTNMPENEIYILKAVAKYGKEKKTKIFYYVHQNHLKYQNKECCVESQNGYRPFKITHQ